VDREGAHLGQLLPHHMECATADDPAGQVGVLGDPELLQRLVVRDSVLGREGVAGQRSDQLADRTHITGAGAADLDHDREVIAATITGGCHP